MENDEFFYELSMSYDELVVYLRQKYGPAEFDYFCGESCKTKNKKISRTDDGLVCHHVYEIVTGLLSNPGVASMNPYDWQKKENLVYCDFIEHLLLHAKIEAPSECSPLSYFKPSEHMLGAWTICGDINEMFSGVPKILPYWKEKCQKRIKDDFQHFAFILRIMLENYRLKYLKFQDEDIAAFEKCLVISPELSPYSKREAYYSQLVSLIEGFSTDEAVEWALKCFNNKAF